MNAKRFVGYVLYVGGFILGVFGMGLARTMEVVYAHTTAPASASAILAMVCVAPALLLLGGYIALKNTGQRTQLSGT